jgi:hypothetical protein
LSCPLDVYVEESGRAAEEANSVGEAELAKFLFVFVCVCVPFRFPLSCGCLLFLLLARAFFYFLFSQGLTVTVTPGAPVKRLAVTLRDSFFSS